MPLFTLHILPNLQLAPIDFRQRLRRLQLGHIRAKFTQYNPLDPGLDGRVDNRLVRRDFSDGGHVDDCILVCESGDELVKGIGVGDTVDFDVGREGGFGGGAGEDLDVACEAGVGVEGGENGGTEIAGGLEGLLGRVNGGGEAMLFTPMTMMFLRIDAIAWVGIDWPRAKLNERRSLQGSPVKENVKKGNGLNECKFRKGHQFLAQRFRRKQIQSAI